MKNLETMTSAPSHEGAGKNKASSNTGMIVGIVAGTLGFIAVVTVGIWAYIRMQKSAEINRRTSAMGGGIARGSGIADAKAAGAASSPPPTSTDAEEGGSVAGNGGKKEPETEPETETETESTATGSTKNPMAPNKDIVPPPAPLEEL